MRRKYGKHIRDARELRHLTQAELADLVGVNSDQVSRWERDAQPPNLDNAVELSRALGLSLDEVAGCMPLGVDLSGPWYAFWQTWRNRELTVNTHRIDAKHYGERIKFKGPGDYTMVGELKFNGQHIKGDYRADEFGKPANGQMFLILTTDKQTAFGGWTGLTGEGHIGKGWGVISRDEHKGREKLAQLINNPSTVSEWPIQAGE